MKTKSNSFNKTVRTGFHVLLAGLTAMFGGGCGGGKSVEVAPIEAIVTPALNTKILEERAELAGIGIPEMSLTSITGDTYATFANNSIQEKLSYIDTSKLGAEDLSVYQRIKQTANVVFDGEGVESQGVDILKKGNNFSVVFKPTNQNISDGVGAYAIESVSKTLADKIKDAKPGDLNVPPSADINNSSISIKTGKEHTLHFKVTDPDSTKIKVNVGGLDKSQYTLTEKGNNEYDLTFKASNTPKQSEVTITVADDYSETSYKKTLNFVNNNPPVITATQNVRAIANDTVRHLEAIVQDLDNDALTVKAESQDPTIAVTGSIYNKTNNTLTIQYSVISPGEGHIRITATDTDNAKTSKDITITGVNRASISSETNTIDYVLGSGEQSLKLTGNGEISLSFDKTKLNASVSKETDGSYTVKYEIFKAGEHSLNLTSTVTEGTEKDVATTNLTFDAKDKQRKYTVEFIVEDTVIEQTGENKYYSTYGTQEITQELFRKLFFGVPTIDFNAVYNTPLELNNPSDLNKVKDNFNQELTDNERVIVSGNDNTLSTYTDKIGDEVYIIRVTAKDQ